MTHTRQKKRLRPRARSFDSDDGIEFVRCRICGDRRRVISGRHLSKHEIDRETYMEKYRLTPDQLIATGFRVIQSSRRDYHPYSKRDWIRAIKKIHKQGGSIFAGDLQAKHPCLYDQGIWLFGDWDKALCAAGFDPEKMRMWSFWDKGKIIHELRRMRKQRLPLYARHVMKNHERLFSGALRHYGSWNKTLIAAGITNGATHGKNRLALLRQLRDALESKTTVSQALGSQLAYYFGSLRKARPALKNDPRILNGWSKSKIIAVLNKMHRSKKSLNHATGLREFPALVSAAESYFGSWGKALYAAGIDPNLYFLHRWWRKPGVRDKR